MAGAGPVARRRVVAAAAAAVVGFAPLAAAAAQAAKRSSEASCRQAANGLVSMLDAKTDDTALYRDTYAVVVRTCGPASAVPKPATPPPNRDACHDLAAALVDAIEDGKMNTAAFVKARTDFARACAPR
jgi:hypothetical protein